MPLMPGFSAGNDGFDVDDDIVVAAAATAGTIWGVNQSVYRDG